MIDRVARLSPITSFSRISYEEPSSPDDVVVMDPPYHFSRKASLQTPDEAFAGFYWCPWDSGSTAMSLAYIVSPFLFASRVVFGPP